MSFSTTDPTIDTLPNFKYLDPTFNEWEPKIFPCNSKPYFEQKMPNSPFIRSVAATGSSSGCWFLSAYSDSICFCQWRQAGGSRETRQVEEGVFADVGFLPIWHFLPCNRIAAVVSRQEVVYRSRVVLVVRCTAAAGIAAAPCERASLPFL